MWSHAIELFQEYMGSGLILIWFLVSLVYLFIVEKRRHIRVLFLYVPVILLLLFFNPLFAQLVFLAAGDEIYYRILWLLPITIVIAFAVVTVIGRLQGIRKTIFGVAAAAVIAVSGSYIYANPYFSRAENLYHVPQSVVDICEAIKVEGREVRAVFPVELLQYVRQYSAVVCMPYGRDILVREMTEVNDWWDRWENMYDLMEAETVDAKALATVCRLYAVFYIVLPADKPVSGDFADEQFEVFAVFDDYIVYKDATINLQPAF